MIKCWNCGMDYEESKATNDAIKKAFDQGFTQGYARASKDLESIEKAKYNHESISEES